MKKYEKYKDSGIPWIGEVPQHWEIKKLKYCINNIETGKRENTNENEVYSIGGEHITFDGKVVLRNPKFISKNFFEQYKKGKIKKDDILIVKDGATIGKTAYIDYELDKKMMVNEHVYRVEAHKYYYYFFLSDFFQKIIRSENQSSAQEGLPLTTILNIPSILIPSLEEKSNIVKFLDRKTAQIDELIAKKERLLELYEEEKKAIINQAVTRGINPDVKLKDSGIPWLGKIPAHWEVKKLKYLGTIKYGLGQPPRIKTDGLPLIRATNIFRGKIDDKDMIFVDPNDIPYDRDPVLKKDNIIIVRSGAYTADSAIIPEKYEGAITGYDMVFGAYEYCNPKFISYCLLSDYVLNKQLLLYSLRAAQSHLNREDLGETMILFPIDFEEQIAIVAYIEKQTSYIDYKIEKTKKLIELLKEYKTALISEVVKGKRKVY